MSPLEYPHSIARGHDCGITSSLPELSNPSPYSISLIRLFGRTVHTNDKTSSGYSISFASDCPSMCVKKILSATDHNCTRQVTFIRTKEKWQVNRENYKNLHHI